MRDDLKRDVPTVHGCKPSISHFSQLICKTRHRLLGMLKFVADRLENGVGIIVLLQGDERWRRLYRT